MRAQNGRESFWKSGSHFHFRFRHSSEDIKFNEKFINRLIGAGTLRKAHHLPIDCAHSLGGRVTSEDFRNTRDAVLVAQMALTRR